MVEPRDKLLSDAAYFATELNRRLEALEGLEPDGQVRSWWQQAAAVTKRIKRYAVEADRTRRLKEARKLRAERIREAMR